MKTRRKTRIYKSLICAMLILTMTAAVPAFAAEKKSGVVRNPNGGSYVNLRAYPAFFGDVLTRIMLGTKVDIVGREGDWYAVRLGCLSGYMHSNFIKTTADKPAQKTNAWVRTFNGGRLNLRSYASTCADILGIYKSGTPVSILDYTPTWCKVSIGDKNGYMKTEYLSFEKPIAAQKPARPVYDCSVFVPAAERPVEWPSSNACLPSWQLAWGVSPFYPLGR